MTDRSTLISRTIADEPGIHFNALVRRLNLAPGQVQYYLRRLLQEGDVVEEPLYGRTHYYHPNYDASDRRSIAVLRRETARDVLVYLLEYGPASPATVTDALDIARSTLEWHLGHLEEQSLVEKQRDQQGHVTLVATRPAETLRFLGDIEPTMTSRLTDRFTRLVDRLLSE